MILVEVFEGTNFDRVQRMKEGCRRAGIELAVLKTATDEARRRFRELSEDTFGVVRAALDYLREQKGVASGPEADADLAPGDYKILREFFRRVKKSTSSETRKVMNNKVEAFFEGALSDSRKFAIKTIGSFALIVMQELKRTMESYDIKLTSLLASAWEVEVSPGTRTKGIALDCVSGNDKEIVLEAAELLSKHSVILATLDSGIQDCAKKIRDLLSLRVTDPLYALDDFKELLIR
ncbi:MAG: hypothetical protein JRM80_00755 [Nitrososphaerota archaeon]|nr:hypothetical protein [Nitrososphaerota archaeon]MDG6960580.1 hypothetical protein [Nitrososphaerota archaeon]MDG6973542.1 hypothetical protein [Nitrososphaerota archaeon]MDG7014953.1 hypothetical protein [Nitrososphaerota archaeon]WGO50911.1 MAG: hypothetical protein JRM93_02535 [Nitrososphaerota archaeon]